MMFKNPNGRTLYEITLQHADGRKFLLCYISGTPSKVRMVHALRSRWDEVERITAVSEWTITRGKVLTAGDWTIQYSGRTEWEAQNGQSTLQSAGELLAADSGSLTLPWAMLAVVGYMVYWMIAHGVFQALTALQR